MATDTYGRILPDYVKAGFVSTVTLFIMETVESRFIILNINSCIHFWKRKYDGRIGLRFFPVIISQQPK